MEHDVGCSAEQTFVTLQVTHCRSIRQMLQLHLGKLQNVCDVVFAVAGAVAKAEAPYCEYGVVC